MKQNNLVQQVKIVNEKSIKKSAEVMPRKPNYKDLLKKFKKRNIKNPERVATAYVKGLTVGSKKKAAKNLAGIID